ncbi:MAG TPA: PilZ domain-containing protein [Vicinamibacteria bacterium]|nr:PilZ domain-containing protein [Vicinamibacteria bacterium]
MPSSLLVAGLDARSLQLEAPVLQRDRHLVEERGYARDLLREIVPLGARLVVLGTDMPDLSLPETVQRIRASAATREVSVLALLPAGTPTEVEEEVRQAGANAVLRRPLDRPVLEGWLAKLLAVPRRVVARAPVSGQVVGTPRSGMGAHFCGLTHNLSVNGMLLASPLRLLKAPDLDLEFVIPGVRARLSALGRVVRDAPEVAWPFRGYGVEFLFVPEESQVTISRIVSGVLRPGHLASDFPDQTHGIHSTVSHDDWIYEIREPIPVDQGWELEIRRAPRLSWRPGAAGPFFVIAALSPEMALREAREFVGRQA